MPHFSLKSAAYLQSCHPEIINICQRAILYFDFSVLCGVRNKEEQDKLKEAGKSKVYWPNSNHNVDPRNPKSISFPDCSVAVDIVPYPLDWHNQQSFFWLSQVIKQCAREQSIVLDWGWDLWGWDMPHWQLKTGEYS